MTSAVRPLKSKSCLTFMFPDDLIAAAMLTPPLRGAYSRAELERLIAPRSIAIVGASSLP